MSHPNNQGNVYAYCANNPVINIDPTGNTLFSALGMINKSLNLAAALDDDFEGLASSFSKFTGYLSDIKDFIMGAQQVFGQENIKVTKNKVIVKTKDGEKVYDKKKMKTEFQKLAQLQQEKSEGATKFEKDVKDNYKDYFDAVRGNEKEYTLIGLRGWGSNNVGKENAEIMAKSGKHPYDDMLLLITPEGRIGVLDTVNFEGSTAVSSYVDPITKKTVVNRDGTNPSIKDGNFSFNFGWHNGKSMNYAAFWINNNLSVPIIGDNNVNTGKTTMEGSHIHIGGVSWNWSEGCLTIFDPTGNGQWARFMSYFPKQKVKTIGWDPDNNWRQTVEGTLDGRYAGNFSVMSL